jgi:hypothetical protein
LIAGPYAPITKQGSERQKRHPFGFVSRLAKCFAAANRRANTPAAYVGQPRRLENLAVFKDS